MKCVVCKKEYTKSRKWSSCKLMNEQAKRNEKKDADNVRNS